MKLKKNIFLALLEQKGETQKDFAKNCGVSSQAISAWARGERNPKPSSVKRLAAALNCSVEDIVEFENKIELNALRGDKFAEAVLEAENKQENSQSNVREPDPDSMFVPVISSAAAASCNPGLMPMLDFVNQYSEEKIWFKQAKKGDFAIEVEGSSMSPWYPDGTILLIRPYQELSSGQRVVAVLDDGSIIFKIYAEKDDKICLFSIDGNGKDYVFTKPHIPIRFICRVIASQRDEDALDEEMRHRNLTHDWQTKLDHLPEK